MKEEIYPITVVQMTVSHALLVSQDPIATDACSENCLRALQVWGAITVGVLVGVGVV